MFKRLLKWFHNHSLRFKIVSLLFLLALALQIINGIIFFSIVTSRFERTIMDSNQATLNQMATNVNRILEDIVSEMVPIKNQILSYQMVAEEGAGNQYAASSIEYQELFDQLITADENYQFINSMFVLGSDGENYYYTLYSYMRINNTNLFQKISRDYSLQGQVVWSSVVNETYFFTSGEEKLISIIMPVYRYNTVKNLLVVNLDLEELESYLKFLNEDGNNPSENMIFIQTGNKETFSYDNMESVLESNGELKRIFSEGLTEERAEGNGYCVLASNLEINDWKMAMLTPLSSIQSTTNSMAQFVIIIIISTAIVMLTGVSIIVFTITKPIQKMTRIMEANRHSRALNHRFYAKYNDEVGVLARTYNSLMDEISQLMEDIHREQIQNRNSYFKMLQLQIKPHFLYNTLESVKFMVEMKDEKSVEMLDAIGKFYKLSLSGIYDKVKIREEVEHLSCYLQILKMRYSSKYTYEISVPEEIMEEEIVKFTLQPLVENAVYHGIKQKRQKGSVKITGKAEAGNILIIVWDNGAGIPKEKLREIQEKLKNPRDIELKEHIGILNVHQRLCAQYGAEYGLSVESVYGEYTEIEVKLPYSGKS